MEYKVGDKVRIIAGEYEEDGFRLGDVFTVTGNSTRPDGRGFIHGTCADSGDMIFFSSEVEPVNENTANLNIDIAPATAAINDFAEACERAVAALEKLNALLNK